MRQTILQFFAIVGFFFTWMSLFVFAAYRYGRRIMFTADLKRAWDSEPDMKERIKGEVILFAICWGGIAAVLALSCVARFATWLWNIVFG